MKHRTLLIPEDLDGKISAYAEAGGLNYSEAARNLITAGLRLPPSPKSLEQFMRESIADRTLYLAYTIFEMLKTSAPTYDPKKINETVVAKLTEFKKFVEDRHAEKTTGQ